MNLEDLDLWGDALLLKIAVITGWMLPAENLLMVLQDQFKKKLTESYANCNPEEIEYAFRNYGDAIRDWGKQINLNLIDEVMRPYLVRRHEQSMAEERATVPMLNTAPPMTDEQKEAAMAQWFAEEVVYIKTGKPFEYIPEQLYDYLDRKGRIAVGNDEKWQYLEKAAAWRQAQLQKEVEIKGSADNMRALHEFRAMKEAGCIIGDEIDTVKAIAKKLLFFDLVANSY